MKLHEEASYVATPQWDVPWIQLAPTAHGTSTPPVLPGPVFGNDYILGEQLGGGRGRVYSARQASTGSARAVKIMCVQTLEDPEYRRRFACEARIAASIGGPHFAQAIGSGIDAGTGYPFVAFELLRGRSLRDAIDADGPMQRGVVRQFARGLERAVGRLHRAGFAHADLEPYHVFLASEDDGSFTLKLLSCGKAVAVGSRLVARSFATSHSLPTFSAPEQSADGPIFASTDVYALALLVYYALTGHFYQRLEGALYQPDHARLRASARAAQRGLAGLLPSGFDDWFEHCVGYDPAERFVDATACMHALMTIL